MARYDQAERNRSPYSLRTKIRRLMWSTAYVLFFRPSFHNAYRYRTWLLRRFGASVGRNVRIRRTVLIEQPWNLDIGNDVSIGDRAIVYALGSISIGDRSFISQMSHLCAGTHDYTRSDYPLVRPPIRIGTDCWIAADAFIGPGVTIGDRSVVGARSSVFKDLPADVVAAGNPASPIKRRVLNAPNPLKQLTR